MKHVLVVILMVGLTLSAAARYLGDFPEDGTVAFIWDSVDSSGASVTRATNGTIKVRRLDDGTDCTGTSVTDSEDTPDVGLHECIVDLSDNINYTTGDDYIVWLDGAVIDGEAVNAVLAQFSIEHRYGNIDEIKGVDATTALDTAADTVTVTAMGAGVITATVMATDSITSDEVAATAVTEIQSGLSTVTTAQVNAEVDTALADYDGPTNAEMEARTLLAASYFDPALDTVANVTTVGTLTGHTPQTGDTFALANGVNGFVATKADTAAILVDTAAVDTSTEIRTLLTGSDTAVSTFVPGTDTVANVTTVATLAGHTPQTGDTFALANGLSGFAAIKAETALILADTNELQTDNVPGLIAALNNVSAADVLAQAAAALVAIHLDHLLAVDYDPASKPGVATALLNELVESDVGVSRYTANALEQGPSGGGGDATAANQVTILANIATAQSDLDILTGVDGATLATLQALYAPAKAGDLMGLAADAITASKFDESTAFPLASIDTGSTRVARTGADADTLETLSDEIAAISSPAGSGDTEVDEDTIADDGADLYVKSGGVAIGGASIVAYTKADYDANIYTVRATSTSNDSGAWVVPMRLDAGVTYTIVVYAAGYQAQARELTVT